MRFDAPEYPQEGIDAFRASLEDQERIRRLTFYGAFDGDRLVGTLCMREPQHIGGFFVDAAWQRRGIGRRLFDAMRRDYARQEFTVHASPYAVEVYRHLGFTPTGGEQIVRGLRFTPMPTPPSQNWPQQASAASLGQTVLSFISLPAALLTMRFLSVT